MNQATRLPYPFDLLYDVKTMRDVEAIAKGEGHCSDATPDDLIELFIAQDLEVPECLLAHLDKSRKCIWVHPDGSWLSYNPVAYYDNNAMSQKYRRVEFDVADFLK
jgi:hypothetical protein